MHRIKGAGRFIINTHRINGHASHFSTDKFQSFFSRGGGDFSGVVATNLNTHCFSQYVGITREIFFTHSFYCTWKSPKPVTVTPEIVTPTLWTHRGRKTNKNAPTCKRLPFADAVWVIICCKSLHFLRPLITWRLFALLPTGEAYAETPQYFMSAFCRWRVLRLFRFASSFALCDAD